MAKRGERYVSGDGVVYTVTSSRIRNHKVVWCGRSQTVRCRVVEAMTDDFRFDDPNCKIPLADGTVERYHMVVMAEDDFLSRFTEVA